MSFYIYVMKMMGFMYDNAMCVFFQTAERLSNIALYKTVY